jgi:uncharacterized membrane protein YkvA (DUF1232 family)
MTQLRDWADRLVAEVAALWFCARDPRTPFVAKAIAVAVVAYAFSPIDLIPDFIPVIGLLDDLLLLPIGIWIVLKLVPPEVMAECRQQAARWLEEKQPKPRSYIGATLIVALWLALLIFASWLIWRWTGPWLGG